MATVFDFQDGFEATRAIGSTLHAGDPALTRPKYSIMIPTFKRHDLLAEAITSALAQDLCDDFEVVVVDNDSEADGTNATMQLVLGFNDPRLLYYRNSANLGMTGNWNRCIELARGEWYTLLHDDDWLAPQFLSRMLTHLTSEAEFLACESEWGSRGYDPAHRFAAVPHLRRVTKVGLGRLSLGNVTHAPGILCLKAAALALGGYQDNWYPCADYAFNLRMATRGKAFLLHERLAYYRITQSQTFKADTLSRIMTQSQAIRRAILDKEPTPGNTFLSFVSSVWWCRFGGSRGLDVQTGFKDHPWVRICASSGVITFLLRALGYLVVMAY